MRTKKNGDVAVPELAFGMAVAAHVSITNTLMDIINRFGLTDESELGSAVLIAARKHLVAAQENYRRAKNVKRGRPAKTVGIIQSAMRAKLRTRGAPSTIERDKTIYQMVEDVRARTGLGVKGALDEVAAGIAVSQSVRVNSFKKDYAKYAKSAYYRGKKSAS